jgi:hypothetical protein
MALRRPKGCVAFGRFSLRRIIYTPQSALLGAPAASGIFDLPSNTLLVPEDCPKSFINIGYQEF